MKELDHKTDSGKKWLGKYIVLARQFIGRIGSSFKKRSKKGYANFERVVRKIQGGKK